MSWESVPVMLLGLLCLVGSSGHLVGADQLLITDHIIASVQQASAQLPPPQMDSLPMQMDFAEHSSDATDIVTELHRSLRFEPPKLDFGSWSIGMARSHTVTLVNQNTNRSVYLSSVSGKTPAFYSSFFEAKVVPPQGNTTFSVVFLPRSNGAVATNLLIHTSFGQAKLLVQGEGRECPYRLKPIVGIRAPLNSTLTPEIHMYNPHAHPLQILEVYSSGGQFQLELPSGGQEGPQTLWEIPAYATKPVIRIRFNGQQAGNHTAYIRIKIADNVNESTHSNENVLVIPVEFEILPRQGLYAQNPLLDFGRLTSRDKARQLKLQLQSSIERQPQDIVDYVLPAMPGLTFNTKDATVSLDPQQFSADTRIEHLLVVKAAAKRNASHYQDFTILIRAEVFDGNLTYDQQASVFVVKAPQYVSGERRTLTVHNLFRFPLAILNVSVAQHNDSVFQLQLNSTALANNVILQPGDSLELLQLQLLDEHANYKGSIQIYSNVSTINVPLVACSGLLHVQTVDGTHALAAAAYATDLNLGIVPFAETSHNGYIVLHNHNPLTVKLTSWDFQTPQSVYFHTAFMGCLRAAALKSLQQNGSVLLESSKFKFCSQLGQDDVAVYQVAIKSYTTDEHMGSLKIWTPYELITATVQFKTWIGKLEVDQEQLYFKNCFPGKLCSSDLSIRSTFLKPMRINSINFTDAGLTFKDFDAAGSWIAPEATTKVGRIFFEPSRLCQNRCYIPQDEKSSAIAFPVPADTKGGANNNLHFDETELRRRTELFRHLKWYFQTVAFTLNSNEIRQFQLYLIIDIEWPKLVSGKQTLPTIEVGQQQQLQVIVSNPANQPILVDYFLADPAFSKDTQLSLPLEVVDICTSCYLTDKQVFSLPSGAPKQPLLLPAATSQSIDIRFAAAQADTYSTLLHIRSNLTLYEAVWVTAKTVQSQFKFGNRKPGSSTPLLFEVNEKHLSACTNSKRDSGSGSMSTDQQAATTISTKRTFTARNTGEIPIWIESFLIGEQVCEGYGFKVIDCSSFALQANASKKIEIAFSPDFTTTRVSRPLRLQTNLSYDVNYILLAIMPPVSLDQCAAVLLRPPWEQRIRNAALVLLATTFVCVLIAAHIDYGNVLLHQSVLYMSRDKGPVHPTFNLRNIALKAQQQAAAEQQQQLQQQQQATVQTTQRNSQRTGQQQQQHKGNHMKKRGLKKSTAATTANGATRNNSSSLLTWPLELSALKGVAEKGAKSIQTFSERSYKLKLEADKCAGAQSTSSNSSVSSSESSAKSTPPKAVTTATIRRTETPALTADKDTQLSTHGTRKQKAPKKSKPATPSVSSEKIDKDNVALRSCSAKSPKLQQKPSGESKSAAAAADNVKPTVEAATVSEIGANKQPAHDSNGSGRKYGKTPGRERKKDLSNVATDSSNTAAGANSKRAERRQRAKASNALNFNTSPIAPTETNDMHNNFNVITAPWDTNAHVSFSHVLQSQQTAVNVLETHSLCSDLTLDSEYGACNELPLCQANIASTTDVPAHHSNELNQQQPLGGQDAFNAFNTLDSFSNGELGPIGSKKSPSSTPVWEPLAGTSATVINASPPLAKPSLSNNSSFFSNMLPAYGGYNEQQQPAYEHYEALPPALYELKKTQEALQRQWQTNEYLLQLRQQQLQAQQHSQHAWNPMGYAPGQNSSHVAAAPAALSPWQRPTAMRPPPGLEQNYQGSQLAGATVQGQVVGNGSEPHGAAGSLDEMQDMQTFDPFSSLSSIWSENWNKNSRNDLN